MVDPQHAKAAGIKGRVRYATSELMWGAWAGKPNRADILCLDESGGTVIVELKKIRQTNFKQISYYRDVLKNHWPSLSAFVEALTGDGLAREPQIRTVFIMPGLDGDSVNWKHHASDRTGLVFFRRTFTPWPGREPICGEAV